VKFSNPAAQARDQIRIVGSSTVFPFSTAVAEQFGKTTDFATPVVESTGSGGGAKLFCAGVGVEHPDITNASRRMKAKEFKLCQENGVTEIIESIVGYDGIVVANAIEGAEFDLTVGQLWTALAANGPLPMMWNEIDPALPVAKIGNCEEIEMRADGVWVDAGENDNLMVSKLTANPNAVAVFGFSFLDQNSDAFAVLLHQESTCWRDPWYSGVRKRVRFRGGCWRRRIFGGQGSYPAARRCFGPSSGGPFTFVYFVNQAYVV